MFSNDEVKAISNAYWEEVNELKNGTHPTQVTKRIEQNLTSNGVEFQNVTYLNWNCPGSRVKVSLDNKDYGIFNYQTNNFERKF